MIDQTIESRSRLPVGAVLFMLASILALAVAWSEKNVHLAVFSVLPIAIAIALWRASGQRFWATIREDNIELFDMQSRIPFGELVSVSLSGKGKKRRVVIESQDGVIHVPDDVDVSLTELCDFLKQRVPPQPESDPHPDMANYHAEQVETFGDDRVWIFRSRESNRPTLYRRIHCGPYVAFAVMIAGILWCFAPLIIHEKDATGWIGGGVILGLLGFLFWIILRQTCAARKVPRKMRDACLIISPLGIAMIQGDVRGKLRWDEIRQIKGKGESKGVQLTNASAGLHLLVEGSRIVVMNIYDASLATIEEIIRRHE